MLPKTAGVQRAIVGRHGHESVKSEDRMDDVQRSNLPIPSIWFGQRAVLNDSLKLISIFQKKTQHPEDVFDISERVSCCGRKGKKYGNAVL